MESYWKSKPVFVTDSQTPMLCQGMSNADLLASVTKRLSEYDLAVSYRVIRPRDNPEIIQKLVLFLNQHYIRSPDNVFRLEYTPDVVSHFCSGESIVVEFSPRKHPERVVGYFCGCPHTLQITGTRSIRAVEANFLCLVPQLRKLGVGTFMMDVLTKVVLEVLEVGIYHYTISRHIKSSPFAEKFFYYRYLNLPNLQRSGAVHSIACLKSLIKLYNSFDGESRGSSGPFSDKVRETLYERYLSYSESRFDIFVRPTLEDFTDAFDKFINICLLDEDEDITDYFCFCVLDIVNTQVNEKCRTAFLYRFFIGSDTTTALNRVFQHLWENDVADQVAFTDIFDEDFSKLRCVQGNNSLRYYLYNFNMVKPANHRIGLVTL